METLKKLIALNLLIALTIFNVRTVSTYYSDLKNKLNSLQKRRW